VTAGTDARSENVDIRGHGPQLPEHPHSLRLQHHATARSRTRGIGRNHGIPVLAAGGISNHAHLLVALPVDVTVAKAIQVMKANSSRWLHEHGLEFAWQEGYGAFSVSSSNVPAVKDYIEHQTEHHRGRSYETEFEAMLRKSGMRFDTKEAFG